ncbi:MAG TPA: hypothetical protein VM802_10150 [Chitinophaga sp.]|uniref:hypothetical protein n=1 Tax=Chitinophaga sp. TaxID=1869181 RepID=UPI002BCCE643|nr:hypothetical protein [Chitinophaga sp.]HVI45224.1 hypothetical protein [Chitinophaga sp.]
MPKVQIVDDVSSIRIARDGLTPQLVHKWQVRVISIMQGDTLCIDIGEGPLRHIYIRFSDVTSPIVNNVIELQNRVIEMLGTHFTKQDTTNSLLVQTRDTLKQLLDTITANGGIGGAKEPMRIDESIPNILYKGYSNPGVEPNVAAWAIERVERNGDIFSYRWAEGTQDYRFIWDLRYELSYRPLA